MKANDAKRLKLLEVENARLKKLLAETEIDKSMLNGFDTLIWPQCGVVVLRLRVRGCWVVDRLGCMEGRKWSCSSRSVGRVGMILRCRCGSWRVG